MTRMASFPARPAAEPADYNGYRYAVGGGAAFFLGLLTAGLYPGLAVIARLRRHRADESHIYFRAVDRLRERLGQRAELDRVEALADQMRQKAARGVPAILAAVAVSVALLAIAPVLAITYEAHWGTPSGGQPVSHRTYIAEEEVLTAGAGMAGLVVALLAGWVAMALAGLVGHRRRTVRLLDAYNALARELSSPPVRVYPAGLAAGQVFWLVLTCVFAFLAGLAAAALLGAAYPGLREQAALFLLAGVVTVVLPTYVWVAMVWSNHAVRWNGPVLAALAESLAALLRGREDRPRFCRSPVCGAANRSVARYCGRCGQALV